MQGPLDQNFAAIRDTLPRLWWNLYQGCLSSGFDDQQAMKLTQTWMLSQNPNGIQPPSNGTGPKADSE